MLDVPFEEATRRNEARDRVVPGFVLAAKWIELKEYPVTLEDGFDHIVQYDNS